MFNSLKPRLSLKGSLCVFKAVWNRWPEHSLHLCSDSIAKWFPLLHTHIGRRGDNSILPLYYLCCEQRLAPLDALHHPNIIYTCNGQIFVEPYLQIVGEGSPLLLMPETCRILWTIPTAQWSFKCNSSLAQVWLRKLKAYHIGYNVVIAWFNTWQMALILWPRPRFLIISSSVENLYWRLIWPIYAEVSITCTCRSSQLLIYL